MIYFIVLLILIFLSFYYDFYLKIKSKDIVYYLTLFIFIFLVSFRYKLGGDTFNYIRDFNEFPELQDLNSDFIFNNRYAPFWVISFSFIKTVSSDFVEFQLIHAIILNFSIFYLIHKYSRFQYLSILIYFIFYYLYFNTEILRESISICFFIFAMESLFDKRYFKYYLFILFAVLFHYSAIFLFLLPFLTRLKINIFNSILIYILLYFTPLILLDFAPIVIKNYYEEYILYKPSLGGYIYSLICFVFFPYLCLYINKKYLRNTNPFEFLIPLFFLISFYSLISPSISLRFFNYLIPFACIFFSNLLGLLITTNIIGKGIAVILTILFIYYRFTYYFADKSDIIYGSKFHIIWYPYTSVFNYNTPASKKAIFERETWLNNHYSNLVDELTDIQQ